MNCYTFKYKVEGRGFSFLSVLTIDKANNAVEFYRQPLQKTGDWNMLTFEATTHIIKVKYSQKQTRSNHDVNRKNAQNLPSLAVEIFSIFLEISISRNFGKVKIPMMKCKLAVNYFCVRHKNRRKHNQHSKLLFFNIILHFDTSD